MADSTEPRLSYRVERDGSTRVDLMVGERSVSWLWIVPLTIRVGKAIVRVDGIGGVNTREDSRRQGFARRVLEAAAARMREGDAALSMLYGIPNFYPRFGYATAGPDHFITLTRVGEATDLPQGWQARPFAPPDFRVVRALYDQGTASGVGCAVRSPEADPWRRLRQPTSEADNDCRVVLDPSNHIRAYAWRARWHWSTGSLERDQPDALVMAEIMADGPESADAILAACRAWAIEESERRGEPVRQIILVLPPEGPVATAAMYQPARFVRRYVPCGSSMVRGLDVGRLLDALKPELTQRLRAAGWPLIGTLRFQTDIGTAALVAGPNGTLAVQPQPAKSGEAAPSQAMTERAAEAPPEPLAIRLPQMTLARLALGAFPPEDLLARLEEPVPEEAAQWVRALFPLRHPHMYLPDRY